MTEPRETEQPDERGADERDYYRDDERGFREEPYDNGRTAWDSPPPTPVDPDVDADDADGHQPGTEMGFFDHLEELRWRIIKSLIGLIVTAVACSIFYKELTAILLAPAVNAKLPLISIVPMGQITLVIQIVLFSGLILAIPLIIWQFWGFIKPGLFPKERKYVSAIAVATIFCFLTGVAFAYFVMIPTSLDFVGGFVLEGVKNQINVGDYLSFVLGFILACGGVFEMPMLSYALSRFGIATPAFLRNYRRHAGVVILIVAAIITPTPDPINQLFLAVPLYALYEVSILVSQLAMRQRKEAMEA